jgi:hypothetical protein
VSLRRATAPAVLAAAVLITSSLAGAPVWGAFSAKATNSGNSIAAADDFRAPTTSNRAIGKIEGGTGGFVRPGGSYRVYAQATDTGNPASGVASVTANLTSITSGQSGASLSSGSYSFDQDSFSRRSSTFTVGSGLSAGSYSFSLTLTDNDGNRRTETGYTVTVDNTSLIASNVQATNKSGGISGRPEVGDRVTFTFSDPPDPEAILGGWYGSSTAIVVRIDNDATSDADDRLRIYDVSNTTMLSLGSVDLGRDDYVTSSRTFGASGTDSTMVISSNTLTVTLGNPSGSTTTAGGNGTMSWSPSTSATDRAGNAMTSTSVNESGSGDRDF